MPLILSGSAGLSGNVGTTTKEMLPAGTVLQVVQSIKSDAFVSSLTGWNDIPGLVASITPISTTSKILARLVINGGGQVSTTHLQIQLLRNSTPIGNGDANGTNTPSMMFLPVIGSGDAQWNGAGEFLDSPNSAAAVTYKAQFRNNNSSGVIYINRTPTFTGVNCSVTSSQLTLMEIKA